MFHVKHWKEINLSRRVIMGLNIETGGFVSRYYAVKFANTIPLPRYVITEEDGEFFICVRHEIEVSEYEKSGFGYKG